MALPFANAQSGDQVTTDLNDFGFATPTANPFQFGMPSDNPFAGFGAATTANPFAQLNFGATATDNSFQFPQTTQPSFNFPTGTEAFAQPTTAGFPLGTDLPFGASAFPVRIPQTHGREVLRLQTALLSVVERRFVTCRGSYRHLILTHVPLSLSHPRSSHSRPTRLS